MDRDSAIDFSKIDYVFLDRDGVLNRAPGDGRFVTCREEFELLPGVADAIAELNHSGRKVIVVTNQRGIALGLYSAQDLEGIHIQLHAQLAERGAHLDAIYVCPHDEGQCNCRKPLTGLFEQAFQDFPLARAENSLMVGDSLCDIQAGVRAGMASVFLMDEAREGSPEIDRARMLAQFAVPSLSYLVRHYLCVRYPM